MSSFAFVILHYGSAAITQSAIDSIRTLPKDDHSVKIIVVDNASPNATGMVIFENNQADSDFFYLKNDENLGFAKGNNVGFNYAKYQLKSDFIILMNNDVEIESEDFYSQVEKNYIEKKFAVLGPGIYTLCGKMQNPLRHKMLKGFRLWLTCLYVKLDICFTWLCLVPLLFKVIPLKNRKINFEKETALDDVELHGSFLIFSREYISRFDGLEPRTFMYCEEEILFARCVASGLISRYDPHLRVCHKEASTDKNDLQDFRKRRLFRLRSCLSSLKLYKKVLRELF